ncbi:hypothetical protein ERJ75_000434600 [Trypanosoma vivax]|nr:hypothetical protein ERJ75_000434600 [Trypanosoma vivax]
MEDFLVEEELQFRALVVLARHLDVFGFLKHLSPYARLTLWNLLDRDEELFDRLCSVPTSPEEVDWHDEQLRALRQRVAEKRAALNATRVGAREAAQRLAWYAVSAHWRDKVMRVLEEGEETDWCLLCDTAKMRSRAVFPNYGVSPTMRDIALKALRRVRDGTIDCGPLEDVEECYEVIAKVLVPLLEGSVPYISPNMLIGGGERVKEEQPLEKNEKETKQELQINEQVEVARRYEAVQEQYETLKTRVGSLLVEMDGSDLGRVNVAREIRWNLNSEPLLPPDSVVCTFVTSIFVWPLQCLASLLELVSVGCH